MSVPERVVAEIQDPTGQGATEPINLDDPRLYINRELSLLEFHRRVLEEAEDEQNPLLERVKFLAIFSSIVDEFFMVRVAGLWHQIDAGAVESPPDGMSPTEQLGAVREVAYRLMLRSREVLHQLLPELEKAGIRVLDYGQLDARQRAWAVEYFEEVVFPVLTPLAFDPGRPFPHISNLSLNLAVAIRGEEEDRFARVKVPDTLPRLIALPRDSRAGATHDFVWIEQVIIANLDRLFPGMEIIEAHPFRITRDAELEIQELEADDLLEEIEETVRQRRFGYVLRVAVDTAMPQHIRDILFENLELDTIDVYTLSRPLGLSSLMTLCSLDRPDLKFPTFTTSVPAALVRDDEEVSIFDCIRRQDILLHHPFDSFDPVLDFLRSAARDPQVLAIKQTLYRVGKDAPVVKALLEAIGNGKQVAVLVELKARFDEESNIEWARQLEREGVHVVYGLLGLKTHSKIALVVRREGDHINRYVHLATGNYNAGTAKLYTDLGFFTCDEDIGADASDLFNYLTGYSAKRDYRKLLVAPINLRSCMETLIEREIEHQKAGRRGHLIFKMNSLVDKPMIKLLYKAAMEGVRVDLLVRGVCCLQPGIRGISENISVTSIVGRYLEHSRIYYFRNGGQEEVYLGSADLMTRNLNRRVEVLFPIEKPEMIHHLRNDVLQVYLDDNVKARRLGPEGHYARVRPADGEAPLDSQTRLIREHVRAPVVVRAIG